MKIPIVAKNKKILIPNIAPRNEKNKRLIPNAHNKDSINVFLKIFIKYPFFLMLSL